ncbi:MAG: flagellar basal body-associated protein FliL [Gammaproteobacteria bacterium]|nr:MAG: flagellar basal body-associated protein FliL [Pseudomonadota bacterium]PIE38100.1 MAG: flagellar basal body-associated protein FliL [Gammaproteobacteria bacterium]
MAATEAAGNQNENAGGSKKKLIIIIAIIVLVSVGASIGVTMFFLGGDHQEAAVEAVPAVPVRKPAIYYEFSPAFIVAINVGGKQRYMQIHLSVMGRDQAAFDVIEQHMPLVRNKLITLYGSQDFRRMQTPEGKAFVLEESRRIIMEVLDQESDGMEIERALFSNFVMQ